MRREQVTVGHKEISYLVSDTPPPAIKQHPLRTVVFLHAFPLSAQMWETNLGALPDGWRGIAPDFRGFGTSPLPKAEHHRMSDFAGDVIDLLERLGIAQAVFVGCSMGGYVAFEVWKSAAPYVSGLVLVSTRANADAEEGKAGRRTMIEQLDREGVESIADTMIPKLLGATAQRERPELVKHLRTLIVSNTPEAVRTAILAIMERRDSTPLLGNIKVPTAIIAGAEDTLIPVSAAESMHGTIMGSTLEVIALAGHLPNLEQTAVFDTGLSTFLQKL